MNSQNVNPKEGTNMPRHMRHPDFLRALAVCGWVLLGLLVLIVIALTIATGYLSNKRFNDLFDRYASQYFDADIHAHNMRFTIWSTFPHFTLQSDSMTIVSRTLRDLPEDIRRQLPENADTLAVMGKFKGQVNVLKLLKNRWQFKNVQLDGLKLNLVEATDSISNYDIIPEDGDTETNVPYITANSIKLTHIQDISYFSLPAEVEGRASIGDITIKHEDGKKNLYDFMVDGKIWADVGNTNVFQGLPFALAGKAQLHFFPFAINIADTKLKLSTLNASLNLNVNIGNTVNIRSFNCNLNSLDLLALYKFVADKYFPTFADLVGHVELDSSVELTAPYNVNDTVSPGLVAKIGCLKVIGDDIDCDMSAQINNIFTKPHVKANVRGDINLDLLRRFLPFGNSKLTGNAYADLDFGFDVDPNDDYRLSNITLDGLAKAEEAHFNIRSDSINGIARNAVFSFNTTASGLTSTELIYPDAHMQMTADNVKVSAGSSLFTMNLMQGEFSSEFPALTQFTSADNLGVKYDIKADGLRWDLPKSKLWVRGANIDISGSAMPHHDKVAGGFTVRADTLVYHDPDNNAKLAGLHIRTSATPVNDHIARHRYPGYADSVALRALGHSPVELDMPQIPELQNIIQNWRFKVDFTAKNGLYLNKAYPAWNHLDYINLSASLDSLVIRRLRVHSQSNRLVVSGKVSNMREVLSGVKRAPIKVDLDLDIDTLSINEIAAAYETGAKLVGKPVHIPDSSSLTHADSVAWIVPRNIVGNIRARARSFRYTNLDLYDLGTNISVRDGRIDIDSLRVNASFGHALFDVSYDSHNIDSMRLSANARVLDVDVVKFFEKYHTLLEMMPQMKNLQGMVSVGAQGSFDLFPNMFMVVPSLRASIWAKGWDLRVHQNHFIRHITRMMLIPDSKDLLIHDIEARADVHDNLLQVPPFEIAFSKYRIKMMGENDFQGHLNYHISVLHSPIPIRFGINIRRTYHDPSIRLGTTHYDAQLNEKELTVVQNDSLNIISKMKYYLKKFVHNASESADKKTAHYAFPTK